VTDLILAIVLGLIALLPASVTGTATWYATGPGAGHAAAGPALRTGDWRGRHVTVCATRCVTVVLDDWCACPDRVIDLAAADFAELAPLSQGVLTVTITTGLPIAPPTDTAS
jgi:rare lipoprotein A (peptidoglycan hydrolase)